MWQENQAKCGCAHQTERGEQAEVAQKVRLSQLQTHKRADCRQAAEENRFGLILQHALGGAHIFIMCDDVQTVA